VLAVEGADRADFLQGQLTQDVKTLPAGQSRLAAGLTPRGKLLYWGRVWNAGDRFLLVVPAGALAAVVAHLSKYAVFQKVAVRDAADAHAVVGLYGPEAAALAPPAGGVPLPPEGEFAAEILLPRARLEEWEGELSRAGSRAVSEATAEILRVEAGRPRLGKDADESNLPEEVGLSEAISSTKGCYVGQEVVARLRTYGRVNRRLVGFRFPNQPVSEGTVFRNPEKPDHLLARVSSAADSPRFGRIGLGLAFRDIAEGQALRDPASPGRSAIVARIPFV
jgi:folate-binding protein YgfZ